MKFNIASIALFGASALAAPAEKRQNDGGSWQISDFTARKSDGYTTSTVFFTVTSTADGTKFECSQNGINGQPSDPFVQARIYSCGTGAPAEQFTWSYKSGDAVAGTPGNLILTQTVGARTYSGQTTFKEPTLQECRKGSTGEGDQICTVQQPFTITLESS